MEYLYFVCHWIIRSYPDFNLLIKVSKELSCELSLIPGSIKNSDGYHCFDFLLKVDNRKTLNEFIERAGIQVQMTEWLPTTIDYYLEGNLLADLLDIEKYSSNLLMLTAWIDTIIMMGRVNEALEKKLTDRG
jgi:hypothetical protein